MDPEEGIKQITKLAQEIVTPAELSDLLSTKQRPEAYIGFEPSGFLHVGSFLITSKMINCLLDSGFHVRILLADWHAYINDKLGGNIEAIRACGRYMEDAFRFGAQGRSGLDFTYAADMIAEPDYWTELIANAKTVSLSRLKRALTIMGRSENEAELDASKLLYPLMQVTDIFRLQVDVAYAGMDQRKAHMLAREVAEARKLKKPVAVHTPILSGLRGTGRMDPAKLKMSKSDPAGAIFMHDSETDIRSKIDAAFCPREEEGNPVLDISKYILFPYAGKMEIHRDQKYGGDAAFYDYAELRNAYLSGSLHPKDLKQAVAEGLWSLTKPYYEHYQREPEMLRLFSSSDITR